MPPTYSQSGYYTANDRSVIASYTVPGGKSTTKLAVRKGSAGVVLLDLAGFIDVEIVDIDLGPTDDWGYAERNVRGGEDVSNHASGTAIDIDASKHPLGESGTWPTSAVKKIEDRLALYNKQIQIVRWGRDYHGRKDEMHFELVAPPEDVIKVADKIRTGTLGGGAYSYVVGRARFRNSDALTLWRGNNSREVGKLQQELRDFMARHHSSYAKKPTGPIKVDNDYGQQTEKFVNHAKVMLHYPKDFQDGGNATADFRKHLAD